MNHSLKFLPTLRTFFLICIAVYSQFLSAQKGSLTGYVKDSSNNAIASVNIKIEKTIRRAITDETGKFYFEHIPAGSHTLTIEADGYKTLKRTLIVEANKTNEITIIIQSEIDIRILKQIVVKGRPNSGMARMEGVHNGIIYSGKKNEVIILDSLTANTAQNNPRQVLGRVPGANFSETEGAGFPSNGIGFRGLNPTQSVEVNTRQNGYNISADLYGYPESYYLPPLEAVELVEITRGGASLQFGPQFGGVINYVIKSGNKNKPFEFTTQQTGGSFGLFNSFYSAGGTYKKWNYFGYFQYKQSDGWRPNSALKQALGFAKAEYNVNSKFKIGVEYSVLRNRIQMSGGLSDAQFGNDARASYRSRNWLNSPWNILAFTTQYKFSTHTLLTFKSALNISARNLVWRNEDGGPQTLDSIDPVTKSYTPREVEHESFKSVTNELRLTTQYKLGGKKQTLAAGLRYFRGTMKRQGGGPGSVGSDFDLKLYGGEYEYNLDFGTTNAAVFIENVFRFGKRLSITPGFRFEYLYSSVKGYVPAEDSNTVLYPNRSRKRYIPLAGIGIQYNTSFNTNIYANCTQAYRPTDYSNQTPFGVTSKIDPKLKDANGYNADLGWRGNVKNFLNFDVGFFYIRYNKRIGLVSRTGSDGNEYTLRTNVANSQHKGAETYIEINLLKLFTDKSKWGNLSFFNSMAFISAKYISGEFKGKNVEFAPSFINRFGATYSFKGFSTTFLVSKTAKSFSDANNTVYSQDATVGVIPAYQIMDWSFAFKFKKYNLKFGVNNLQNTKYFTKRTDEYPGPGIIPSVGRSFYWGIGVRL